MAGSARSWRSALPSDRRRRPNMSRSGSLTILDDPVFTSGMQQTLMSCRWSSRRPRARARASADSRSSREQLRALGQDIAAARAASTKRTHRSDWCRTAILRRLLGFRRACWATRRGRDPHPAVEPATPRCCGLPGSLSALSRYRRFREPATFDPRSWTSSRTPTMSRTRLSWPWTLSLARARSRGLLP